MITAHDFVSDDWYDMNWYERPQPETIEELAPYWDEMMQDAIINEREIPDGLTIETYVKIWNKLCETVPIKDEIN